MAGFDRPDAPGRDPDAPQFRMDQHLGSLLVLQVKEAHAAFTTEYGDRPMVVADVHVIGPENGGTIRESFPDSFLFGVVLHSQLRGKVGRMVLGILEQGEKRPGQNAPWRLNADVPAAAEAAALKAMQSRPDPVQQQAPQSDPWGSAPAQQQAPAASPWGQQPAAAPAPAAPWGSGGQQPAAPWESSDAPPF